MLLYLTSLRTRPSLPTPTVNCTLVVSVGTRQRCMAIVRSRHCGFIFISNCSSFPNHTYLHSQSEVGHSSFNHNKSIWCATYYSTLIGSTGVPLYYHSSTARTSKFHIFLALLCTSLTGLYCFTNRLFRSHRFYLSPKLWKVNHHSASSRLGVSKRFYNNTIQSVYRRWILYSEIINPNQLLPIHLRTEPLRLLPPATEEFAEQLGSRNIIKRRRTPTRIPCWSTCVYAECMIGPVLSIQLITRIAYLFWQIVSILGLMIVSCTMEFAVHSLLNSVINVRS